MQSRPSGVELLEALESGEVRAAEPGPEGWVVNAWVKEGILDIFRTSEVVPHGLELALGAGESGDLAFRDKEPFLVRRFTDEDDIRLVPGGSAIRRGTYIGPGVVCMPPMYINVGAFVGAGSMIDSHALVGTCAQVGERVHVSAAAQLGGVMEPVGGRPVIIEDGAFIGGNCGVYGGVLVGCGAVLAAGVVLTGGSVVHDLVHGCELGGSPGQPLEIPENAVVIPGSRVLEGEYATSKGLSAACALIVKYRDASTDAATALEDAVR